MRTLKNARAVKASDKRLLRNLKETVQRILPSAELLLYGSVARGTASADSDYDILILTDQALSVQAEDVVRGAIYELELCHGVVISTIFYTKVQWRTPLASAMPFHKQVEKESILL